MNLQVSDLSPMQVHDREPSQAQPRVESAGWYGISRWSMYRGLIQEALEAAAKAQSLAVDDEGKLEISAVQAWCVVEQKPQSALAVSERQATFAESRSAVISVAAMALRAQALHYLGDDKGVAGALDAFLQSWAECRGTADYFAEGALLLAQYNRISDLDAAMVYGLE